MTRPHVLIASICYAPDKTGIAIGVTGLAEDLASRGWDVTVVTGIPHYPAWRVGSVPEDEQGPVRIIRCRHFVPARQSVSRRGLYEISWLASCLPAVLRRRPVDVLLGVTPNLGGAVLAELGARRLHVPYVVMFLDLLGPALRQSGYQRGGAVAGAVRWVELQCARRAASAVVMAEGFRPYLTSGGVRSERVHHIANPVRMAPPSRPRQEVRRRLGWSEDEFVVLHSGNMGFKQGLENLLRAAAQAHPAERLRFILQGDGNQRVQLETMARELPSNKVTFSPLVPAEDLPDVLAAADVLLLNQRREVREMSLPSKLGCYFAAGRPVLAAVSADSEAGREVLRSEGGILVEPDQPMALLDAVRKLSAQPELRSHLGAHGLGYANRELRPETTLEQMHSLLSDAVAEGAAGPGNSRSKMDRGIPRQH